MQKSPWLPPVSSRAFCATSRIDLGERDRGDREVVGAQAQRRQADQQPEGIVTSIAIGSASQNEQPAFDDEDRHRVGADRHEPGLAEVDDAGEADVELQPERDQGVDAGEHADAGPEADVGEEVEGDRDGAGSAVAQIALARRRCPAAGRSGR